MLHAGMDLHKAFSVVTVTESEGDRVVDARRLSNDEQELEEFFSSFDDELMVVLEASGSSEWMCEFLEERGIEAKMCHPLKTRAIASARIKNDKLDSRILADLSRANLIPEAYRPDEATRQLRALMRYRANLVRVRTSLKNRVHSVLTSRNIQNPYSDLFGVQGLAYLAGLDLQPVRRQVVDGCLFAIGALDKQIALAERSARKVYASRQDAKLLSTIPGVGLVFSLTIVSEIGDVGRFPCAKKLSNYAGLVPSTWESGGTTRHGRITRQGSPWLRWAFTEAAIHAASRKGPLRDYYLRQSKRKGKSTAKVAVARKLSTYTYYMLKEKKDYAAVLSHINGELG